MRGQIFVEGDNRLHALSESEYEAEEKLQSLLEEYPDLLAGEQISEQEPRRWIQIDREYGISDDEESSRRWAVDHFFLDQDGVPTLVEVKQGSNSNLRRKVVGQMMDYAANAVRYGDVSSIRRQFHERQEDPDAILKKRLDISEPETYWSSVQENLERGEVRMVFVADDIPSELRRIVEFLNEQMAPAEVLALSVKQYTGDDLKTFVPRVIGQTAAAEKKKGKSTRSGKKYQFYDDLLAVTNRHTTQFREVVPKNQNEIRTTSGEGFSFRYLLSRLKTKAQFYIDFGGDEKNKRAFEVFRKYRDEVENQVDEPLKWIEDDSRRRAIGFVVEGGYETEGSWEETHERLAKGIAQLEKAVTPFREEVQEVVGE